MKTSENRVDLSNWCVTSDSAQNSAEQEQVLKKFAEKLLAETEDSPQEVVEVLNRHFWDLV